MTNILITGANRGIGLALTKAALGKGWCVYANYRSEIDADTAATSFNDSNFHPLIFDVSSHSDLQEAVQKISAPLDILINNAGIMGPDSADTDSLNLDFERFAEILEVNTLGPLRVSQAFLPALRQASMGRILTVSSQMSYMGYAKSNAVAYRTSKSAVNKVMQCLSTDLAPEGIPVVLIDPGWVKTDMGGSNADLDAHNVAKGILEIAAQMNMTMSGKFYKWSGEERAF